MDGGGLDRDDTGAVGLGAARGESADAATVHPAARGGISAIVRDYVVEHMADEDAVLVVDETGFLKQGNRFVEIEPGGVSPVMAATFGSGNS